ncbi:MFS transporter [Lutibacter sp.]|uniref:MFS transporter n=1 Tax=Lutibacter sp. TaxID=1925666 RepID=UPI003564B21B
MFQKLKGFSRAFWTANTVELLERAAYYGVFIVITLYLSRILGFTDMEAGLISGIFSGGLYLLPTFAGALADKIGFKYSLIIAFSLLTLGYFGLAVLPSILESIGLVNYSNDTITYTGIVDSAERWAIVPIMLLLMIGGSFIKSVITGTVAKETTEANRAQGFSIFYMMVNIGAFSGKTIVKPLRDSMGELGYAYINYFSAGMTLLGLIMIVAFYKSTKQSGQGKTFGEIWDGLVKVCTNGRLITLILIITGFWMVQHQLYATMPKYVLRMAGEDASPSWYANVNPLTVVLTVAFITKIMASRTPLFSMTVGMFIMPLSAIAMASGNWFGHEEIDLIIISLHPIALMMIIGIVLQGLAESFISPRFLQFFSLQAPKGEEGMYLGFSHLHSFISSVLGFGLSGYLLTKYCPEPTLFETREAWEAASVNAHYIWYYFAAIALVSAISLIIYGKVIAKMDAKS